MQVFHKKDEIKKYISLLKSEFKTLGLVPTMGALHHGHLALIQKAYDENDAVAVSIFVNPTQFNNKEDLEKYPKTLEKDIQLIKTIATDTIIFAPSVNEIYGNSTSSKIYDFGGLENVMEGAFREGHFDGVGTIVEELLTIVAPTNAYFGEKDFQQLQIIRKMVKLQNISVNIIGCPIVRETHGLAMSSRNERLSSKMRQKSNIIYETLLTAKEKFTSVNSFEVVDWIKDEFKKNPEFKLEYVEITDAETLQPINIKNKSSKYRIFIAVYLEEVRLIDNIALN